MANGGTVASGANQSEVNQAADDDQGIDPSWDAPVDDAAISTAWNEYANSVQASNPYLYTILSNQIPKVGNGTNLVLELNNTMQEDEVAKEKSAIFTFLKKRVKNAKLTLEVRIVEEKLSANKVYTASDKMRVMLEQNPSLADLKRLFDLDLE